MSLIAQVGRILVSKLVIVTTTAETVATILKGQPAWLSAEFDVTVIAGDSECLRRVAAQEQIQAVFVPMFRGVTPIRDLWSVIRMMYTLFRIRPDIVHSYTPKAGLVAMLSSWVCRVPVRVHTFTGLIFPTTEGIRRWFLIWMDRLICGCATRIVPEGRGVKHDLKLAGITSKPLSVIGSGNIAGVDVDYFRDTSDVQTAARCLRDSIGIPSNAFVFVFVGRINRDKGLTELAAAFRAMSGVAHLIIVGALDASAPPGESVLEEMASHPRIHNIGFLDDIRPALSLCDVLVLPSYREGFPNVVLQAGAMQRPAIVTDVNGSNEIVVNHVNGWVVPVRDATALRQAMEHASRCPQSIRLHMGQEARHLVVRDFERGSHLMRLRAFYRNLLRHEV